MAIRDKLRAKFGSKSKNSTRSGDSTPPSLLSNEEHYTGRTDIEYYKPHEIPKSKYGRGRVDPEHQGRLEAYSFGDAFATIRHKTSMAFSGTFSPGGTKALSAAPSAANSRRPSYVGGLKSRASSIGGSGASPTYNSGSVSSSTKISEGSDEDNDSEMDLARIGTIREDAASDIARQATITEKNNTHRKTLSHDQPFTIQELERAMTRATMRSSGERYTAQPIAVA